MMDLKSKPKKPNLRFIFTCGSIKLQHNVITVIQHYEMLYYCNALHDSSNPWLNFK